MSRYTPLVLALAALAVSLSLSLKPAEGDTQTQIQIQIEKSFEGWRKEFASAIEKANHDNWNDASCARVRELLVVYRLATGEGEVHIHAGR